MMNTLPGILDRVSTLENFSEAESVQASIRDLQNEIHRLETSLIKTNQYNRRQNLVINGIPDKVPQHALEGICIDIVKKLGLDLVEQRDVVACHRLMKPANSTGPSPTIIRFTNRKIAEYCMKHKYNLGKLKLPWKLSFSEDLCEANEEVRQSCMQLKEDGLIEHFITRNGYVKVFSKKTAGNGTLNKNRAPVKIKHPKDLQPVIDRFMNLDVSDQE